MMPTETPKKRAIDEIFESLVKDTKGITIPTCAGTCNYLWNGTDWELDTGIPTTCSQGCDCVAPPNALAQLCEMMGMTLQSTPWPCGKSSIKPTKPIETELLIRLLIELFLTIRFWKRLAMGLGLMVIVLLLGSVYFATR